MEVALRTHTRMHHKPKYTDYRVKGAIVSGVTEQQIQKKWVEICCDLMSPQKQQQFTGFRYHSVLTPLWQQSWYDAWITAEKGQALHKDIWTDIIKSGDIETAVGNEPGGKVNATRAWDWSDQERKEFVLIKMDESTWINVTEMNQIETREEQTRVDDGKMFIVHRHRIDWDTDIGISARTQTDIEDRKVIVQPRLDLKRNFGVLKTNTTPSISRVPG